MKETTLSCAQRTAFAVFLLIGCLFLFVGCAGVYKILGLTEEQTQEQVAEDQKTVIKTITQVRTTAGDIITTAIAGIGTIASGFLARWLGTERKITKALITGIESAKDSTVKKSVAAKATAAGVESVLHARVLKLT